MDNSRLVDEILRIKDMLIKITEDLTSVKGKLLLYEKQIDALEATNKLYENRIIALEKKPEVIVGSKTRSKGDSNYIDLLRQDSTVFFTHIIKNWSLHKSTSPKEFDQLSLHITEEILKDLTPKEALSCLQEFIRREKGAILKKMTALKYEPLRTEIKLQDFFHDRCNNIWKSKTSRNTCDTLDELLAGTSIEDFKILRDILLKEWKDKIPPQLITNIIANDLPPLPELNIPAQVAPPTIQLVAAPVIVPAVATQAAVQKNNKRKRSDSRDPVQEPAKKTSKTNKYNK